MPFTMDPYSVALVIAVTTLATAFAVLLSQPGYQDPLSKALSIFGWGKVVGGVGYLFLAYRPHLPVFLGVQIANTLCVLGFYATYWAIREVQRKPTSWLLSLGMLLACLVAFGFFAFVEPSLGAERVATSLFGIFVCMIMAWELLARFEGSGRAHAVTGISMAVLAALMICRLFLAMAAHQDRLGSLSTDWGEQSFFLIVAVAGTMGAVNFLLVSNDILTAELRRQAQLDPLTGIANRRRLFDRGQIEIRRARRFGQPLALLVLDLDHFKRINDTWGHAIGDLALKSVATCSQITIRDIDTVARLGGEEFAVLLPQTEAEAAFVVAERLRVAIAETMIGDPRTEALATARVRLTVSIGIAMLDDERDFPTLLDHADKAMYLAKSSGRNRVVLHAPATIDQLSRA